MTQGLGLVAIDLSLGVLSFKVSSSKSAGCKQFLRPSDWGNPELPVVHLWETPCRGPVHPRISRGSKRLDVVPNGLPFTLNCLWHLVLSVDFGKLGPICCALQLIKNFPNLSKLEIQVHVISDEVEAVLKYLDTPSCLERPLDKLEYVAISDFKSSKVELSFVKLLLSRTPSLRRMCIVQRRDIDIDIALELMRFPRASPRAELFYSLDNFLNGYMI